MQVEAPVLAEQDGGFKVMALDIKLMFWQGLWYEDPEPDLEFYLQYFSPRMAHMLMKYRFLAMALRCFRIYYPWVLMLTSFVQVFLLYPIGIWQFWGNRVDVVGNIYLINLNGLIFTGLLTVLLQKEGLRDLVRRLEKMCKWNEIDNREQSNILKRTQVICHKVTKYVHVVVVPYLSLSVVVVCVTYLLPNRLLHTREWYPWDVESTPSYEITLFLRTIQTILLIFTANTLITFITSLFVHLSTQFEILRNKIQNLRSSSIRNIQERKLKERYALQPVYGRRRVRMNQQRFLHPGAVTEVHLPTVGQQVERSPSRLDDLALLRPLYQVNSIRVMIDRDEFEVAHSLTLHGQGKRNIEESVPAGESDSPDSKTSSELDKEMQRELVKQVERHVELIRLTIKLRDLINWYLAVMFLVNTVTLAATVLLIKTVETYTPKEVTFIIYTAEVMILYLVNNFLTNLITDQNTAVGDALYNSDWLGASLSFKRSMLIIMTRTNVTLQIKPTGLDPLSRKNFHEVLIRAYKMIFTLNSVFK